MADSWGFRTLGSICASLVLVVSAFVLEDRLGTRLLVPASFGVLVILASLFRTWTLFLPVVVVGLGLEMWAFVDQFQDRRAQWGNAQRLNIPRAPSLWRSQYPENSTIFKGLSLYGGVQAREEIEEYFNKKVFLKTWVKVKKNWNTDSDYLQSLGVGGSYES